jgi:histidinol-phosphate aminotransferase
MIEQIVRPCVLHCRDYVPGKPVEEVERELGITNIDKMASNENPLGPSPLALKAMQKEIKKSHRYPESLCVELVNRLAALHGVKPGNILVGNGLDNVITIIGMAFISVDSEVIFGDVSFPAYGNVTRKMGGVCVEIPMNSRMELDLDAFADAITYKTKLIFVCNPNNPTGTIKKKDAIDRFLSRVPNNVVVVFDEAYYEYVTDPICESKISMAAQQENIIALRTFSKLYGLAALRVGYAVGTENLIRLLMKLREPFPVNRMAQAAAVAALDDKAFKDETLKVNAASMKQYRKAFEEMGMKYYTSEANFIYVEIPKPAHEVFDTMLHDGIIVRPQPACRYGSSLRISIGTQQENTRTIESLKRALDN